MTMGAHRLRLILIIAVAALALGLASVAALAAVGPWNPRGPAPGTPPPSWPQSSWPQSCAVPELTGTVVDVTLTDMGGMMGPGMMRPGWNGPYSPGVPNSGSWPGGYPWPGMGMMRAFLNPSTVPAGTVSFRVRNTGMMIHEMMVLPLGPGRSPGQLAIGANGQVDESGSLGEAARTCGEGEGEGIFPGTVGWTTVTLQPGRYEVLCNIAGHYGAGMYTQLDVVGNR